MFCEVNRLEKFKSLVSSIVKERRFFDIVKNVLQSINDICNCRQAVIYMLAHQSQNNSVCQEIKVQKTVIEGRYIDSIQLEGDPIINNFFTKFKEA